MTRKMDELDLQIATLLQDDSRPSFKKIARMLGISASTASNRIRNLEAIGVLKRHTISIDPAKLGFGLTALINIQAQASHLVKLEQEIAQSANVIAVYDIMGDYDLAFIAKFRSLKSNRFH